MKTRIIAAIVIGAIIISISIGYMIYLINEPKTSIDCRMKFSKGTTEMLDCLEKIKNNILTQGTSKVGPLNLYHKQCADLFDSNLDAWSPPNPDYNPPALASIILGTPDFEEFRASDCRLSVFDWAYLSKNEDFIWNSNMQWPEFTQWYESELVYGVCGPDGAIQEDGYCYKDSKRIEFKNTEFEPENKKCFNNYGNGTRIETSCEGIPFSQGPENFDIDCNNLDGRAEAQCFKDAFESCTTAVTHDVIYTIEGDPMYLQGIIIEDCKIHITFDNSGDTFGGSDKGIRYYLCDRIELQEKHMWVISNCTDDEEFQINYQGQEWASHEKCTNLGGEWSYDFHNCVGLPEDGMCQMEGGKPICMSIEQTGSLRMPCYDACEFTPMDRK